MSLTIRGTAVAAAVALVHATAAAQSAGRPTLHVNPRWKQCSFQLDASLTQSAWHQFTDEAGLVAYFRPLSDARPMGRGHFEVSALQWETAIHDADAAWNDTFVHPDSTHWLFEGDRLTFPGVMLRAGVTDRMDAALYVTKNFDANYGFVGGQVQRSLVTDPTSRWAAAARGSVVSLFGPDDLSFQVYGVDLLASRSVTLTRWASVAPYAGASGYLASSHEKASTVSLDDERVLGVRATAGAALHLSGVRLAAEYSVGRVRSLSFKLGVGR
jgi:hypothetical protein